MRCSCVRVGLVTAVVVNVILLLYTQSHLEVIHDKPVQPTATPEPPQEQGHRRRISYRRTDAEVEMVSDERHAAAVLASRGSGPMRCGNKEDYSLKVLVTGLSRSGSTWQYNVVKKILERSVQVLAEEGKLQEQDYLPVASAHADGDAQNFDECLKMRLCVLKTHLFVPRLLSKVDVVLSSHRDVRDVVLSSMLMFGACYAAVGVTRTQRSHGVAIRFQQYAHWSPYVCYDMRYEHMVSNATAEVRRLTMALLGNSRLPTARIDPSQIAFDVDALAKTKPDACVKNTLSKKPPKECWHPESGFAKSHIHASTSRPEAWKRKVVLDEVQRRVPACDVYSAMHRVEQGFLGWLTVHGYDVDHSAASSKEDDFLLGNESSLMVDEINATTVGVDDTEEEEWLAQPSERRRRRLLMNLRDVDPSMANGFIMSLPEARYVMDPHRRLARLGAPALFPRFVHVVNPFARLKPHPLTTIGGEPVNEDEIAHLSISRAWRMAAWYGLDVEVAAAVRRGDPDAEDLASRWPVRRGCIFDNGIDTANGMRLPLLKDLLRCAAGNLEAHYVILTNPDILVHHHFYLQLYRLVLDEREPFTTAWSVTRRQIAPTNFKSIDDVFNAMGEPHLGHDTFIFPRSWLVNMDVANLVPGFSPWGGAFLGILAHLGRAVVLGSKRWTFHLANDGAPADKKNRTSLIKEQKIVKRSEVCENAPGTFYNTREAAAALALSLDEPTPERCCCPIDAASAPHGTTRMPSPNAFLALDLLSGPTKPNVDPLGLAGYEYIWDRLGPDMTLSRCAALPGIQLLPPKDISAVVSQWCSTQNVHCPGSMQKRRNSDCARSDARGVDNYEAQLEDAVAVGGVPLTALVVYEKLPTPFEGGHQRIRQLLSWLCLGGHRVLLVHRDAKSHGTSTRRNKKNQTLGSTWDPPINVNLDVKGCTIENLAIFALDESMSAMTAKELARQRVDVAFLTVWFYRTEDMPIPKIALPVVQRAAKLRQRAIKIALISDDVQFERAKVVKDARGDDPDYWRRVRRDEIEFYSDPAVDVVFAISDDDASQFRHLQSQQIEKKKQHHRKQRGGGPTKKQRNGRRLLAPQQGPPKKPKIGVLPYVARIDHGTAQYGWDGHGESYDRRAGVVFVGGANYANRVAVRWLIRAALPALAALSDDDGGCDASRRAKLVLVGAAGWADEAKKACLEARKQQKPGLVDLLCPQETPKKSQFGKWDSGGVLATGRVDDVSSVLRQSKLFVAPAIVGSGISTKVWLALEHGLPVITTFDGTRGLPKKARDRATHREPPFVLLGPARNQSADNSAMLSRETAAQFATDVARVYCKKATWRSHALAALQLAKDLESREPWSGGPLAELMATPPSLRCQDTTASALDLAADESYRTSLMDSLESRFSSLLAAHGGNCLDLARHGGWGN